MANRTHNHVYEGLQCPKCGAKGLRKQSVSKAGQQRWLCGYKKVGGGFDRGCGWNGTEAVGVEEVRNKGISRRMADKLHNKLSGNTKGKRFVITSAQNATEVWQPFWKSLMAFCEKYNAQLIVIPFRYKNPTSIWSENAKNDDWWDPVLVKYMLDKRTMLHDHLVLLADIKTQPTAADPLRGFETMTGPYSAIIGHPKIEMLSVPTPQEKLPKILVTTGCCTVKNYIPSKAGKKAEHHHTYGACLVEMDETFHIRQINATKDGSFCDLDWEFYPDRAPEQHRIAGLVLGDVHVDFVDEGVVKATFDKGGIVPTLDPEEIVWHDVLDFYSGSHHHRGKVFTNFVKHHTGMNNVYEELKRCFAFIDKYGAGRTNVIVNSNHHNHLERWVRETDPRTDPENAVFWATTFEAMCKNATMTPRGVTTTDPFVFWAHKLQWTFQDSRYLGSDDSYMIKGIEVGYHGDRGANGTRGDIRGYGKIGAKTVIGHSHTPGIRNGVYQTGTSSRLRLEYNQGPSSWLHTHCVIYKNGKRSLINIIDGKWRLA